MITQIQCEINIWQMLRRCAKWGTWASQVDEGRGEDFLKKLSADEQETDNQVTRGQKSIRAEGTACSRKLLYGTQRYRVAYNVSPRNGKQTTVVRNREQEEVWSNWEVRWQT